MSEDSNKVQIHRGLKGVYFDHCRRAIDGRAGTLLYRGYSIHDLAQHPSFEGLLMLLHGELPTQSQLDTLDSELKAARELPGPILDIIRSVKDAHPMEVLRTATSALGI